MCWWFLAGLCGLRRGGSPVAIEAGGSAFYLSTQSTACMRDVISQVMIPGPSGIVSSSLTDGAPVCSNCPRAAVVASTQLRVRWNGCGKEQGQNYENCRCRSRETGYAFATRRWTWYQTIFRPQCYWLQAEMLLSAAWIFKQSDGWTENKS